MRGHRGVACHVLLATRRNHDRCARSRYQQPHDLDALLQVPRSPCSQSVDRVVDSGDLHGEDWRHGDDVLQIVGLNTLNSVVHRSGYKGRAIWSETDIEAPGPRTGLLALSDQEPISLADLPPLPQGANAFAANSFDWSRLYDALLDVAHGIEKIVPNAGPGTVDNALAHVNEHLGINLRDELFGSLGHVNCAYADSGQVPFGLGFGLALEVKDAARLRKALNSVLDQAQQQAGPNLNVRRIDRSGRELVVLEFGGGGFSPAFHVGEKWLSVGIVPQTVDAFLLRLDGKLPTWEPGSELQVALGEMPEKFTAITTGMYIGTTNRPSHVQRMTVRSESRCLASFSRPPNLVTNRTLAQRSPAPSLHIDYRPASDSCLMY